MLILTHNGFYDSKQQLQSHISEQKLNLLNLFKVNDTDTRIIS